jgi:hypothetical protein
MNFGNLAFPFLTLGAPVVAILFFALGTRTSPDAERRASLFLFGFSILVAFAGVFRFTTPIKMEFLLPISTESSGYFEPSIQLHWIRYAWIFFSATILSGLAIFDGGRVFASPKGTLRFLFLCASLLFVSFAYLSENFLLSLMFVEITVFLLHSFGMELGDAELD